MAVDVVTVKCPSCAANLSIEAQTGYVYCMYCGNKVMLNNNKETEVIHRNIDEAKIRELEYEKEIRLKEIEINEKENQRNSKFSAVFYSIAAVLMLIGIVLMVFMPEADKVVGLIVISISIYTAYFTATKAKKRKYVGPNECKISREMRSFAGKNYESLRSVFAGAGFTDIKTVPVNDLLLVQFTMEGVVETVTINGNNYSVGDVVPKDSKVVITYHSLRCKK